MGLVWCVCVVLILVLAFCFLANPHLSLADIASLHDAEIFNDNARKIHNVSACDAIALFQFPNP